MALAPDQHPTNFNMLELFYTSLTLCLGAKKTWVAGDHLRPPGRGRTCGQHNIMFTYCGPRNLGSGIYTHALGTCNSGYWKSSFALGRGGVMWTAGV